jgi:predicted AlkP superfamily phosphohydrolase/phosphomutase/tetratricopeptide (TPR) repeat protein
MSDVAARKVLLIGWDAADWKIINPLLDAGRLPHLQRLVDQGVIGNLATLYPHLSPMLWTSIATGKRPFRHGILGFTEPDPQSGGIRPISVLSRKTKAIWNILCQTGMRCNVVGWWPSHPAEPIRGVMVSNHYQQIVGAIDKPWPTFPGTVHPESWAHPLADLRVHPQQLASTQIQPFVPRMAEVDQDKDRRLETLARIISECSSVQAAALALAQHAPWDFMAVYYDAIDHFSHAFMRYHPPRQEGVAERDFELYQHVVEGGYRFQDMMLGALLRIVDPQTTVILVSDHGFHPDHLRPRNVPREPAGPAVQHRHYGILVMKGPGIKRDERVYGASLLDVCPTILAMLGMPIGEDMDGKPLVTAFEHSPVITTIASWDAVPGNDGRHPPDRCLDPVEASEAIKQLVALGYIEEPPEDRQKAVAQTVCELDYNLARAYVDAGRHADAVTILQRIYRQWPSEYRFGIQLVHSYEALARIGEARVVLEEVFARKEKNATVAREKLEQWAEQHTDQKPEDLTEAEHEELRGLQMEASWNPYAVEYLRGSSLLAEGDEDGAVVHLKRAEQLDPKQPDLYLKLAATYQKMRDWAEVERCCRKALELDPDSAAAYLGLGRSLLVRRRFATAADEALNAVGLLYYNPQGHFLLGSALAGLGRYEDAVAALKVAVSQNPNFVPALRRLAMLYERRLDNEPEASLWRQRAWEAAKRIKMLREANVELASQAIIGHAGHATNSACNEQPRPAHRHRATPETGLLPFQPGRTIVVVSGLPRSGTSLMMQMLAAGGLSLLADQSRPPDADNCRGYFEFAPAKNLRGDATWLTAAQGKVVKIVTQLLGYLPAGFDYRVVLMERNLLEVLASQRVMLMRRQRHGADLADERLQKVFAAQLRHAKGLLTARGVPTLEVDYRDCIEHPGEVTARVSAFLGGDLNTVAMAAVADRALYHQQASHE